MRALVTGAGGFIGGHLVRSLEADGHEVTGVDVRAYEDWWTVGEHALEQWDLREAEACLGAVSASRPDVIFDLAADMGGMGFITTHKADCMVSSLINTHMLMAAVRLDVPRFFFASSACVYPDYRQDDADVAPLKESDAYPAMPEAGYGWQKMFAEHMGFHFAEDYGIRFRTARFHNVYGPLGTWDGIRAKAPASMCRKVAEAKLSGASHIEVWGDGRATRTYMYADDCVRGIRDIEELDDDSYPGPLNLGSDELVTVDELAQLAMKVGNYPCDIVHVDGPQGVRGRSSDNVLIRETLGWAPETPLVEGMAKTYEWVEEMVRGA